jgi:hypothetical protein
MGLRYGVKIWLRYSSDIEGIANARFSFPPPLLPWTAAVFLKFGCPGCSKSGSGLPGAVFINFLIEL